MKEKTAFLLGDKLDLAVAMLAFGGCEDWDGTLDGVDSVSDLGGKLFSPSTNYEQGNAIIERENINVVRGNDLIFPNGNEKGEYSEPLWLAGESRMHGHTPLVAALRYYVFTRLGEYVDLPDEKQTVKTVKYVKPR